MTKSVNFDCCVGTNSKIGLRQITERTVTHKQMYSTCQISCILIPYFWTQTRKIRIFFLDSVTCNFLNKKISDNFCSRSILSYSYINVSTRFVLHLTTVKQKISRREVVTPRFIHNSRHVTSHVTSLKKFKLNGNTIFSQSS